MLGKLVKYEWKNTWKLCIWLLVFIAVITVLGCISLQTPMWRAAFGNGEVQRMTPMDVMGVMTLVLYVFALIGAVVGMLIYLAVHFYKTMYSDEGYLTHTLPVNSHQLLVSKLLVSSIWYLLVMLMLLVSVLSIVWFVFSMAMRAEGIDIWREIKQNRDTIMLWIDNLFGLPSAGDIIGGVIEMIINTFASIMVVFGAITIGQLSSKHKVMMSILSYFGIIVVEQIVSSLVSMPFAYYGTKKLLEGSQTSLIKTNFSVSMMATAISVILAVILYLLSNYIINRKLNLE